MSKFTAVQFDGQVETHARGSMYETLCGLDGHDCGQAVVPVPRGAKITCPQCLQMWRAWSMYRASDFAPAKPKPAEPTAELCMDCDGCGWTEGGETIQTTCAKCGGSGNAAGRDIPGDPAAIERLCAAAVAVSAAEAVLQTERSTRPERAARHWRKFADAQVVLEREVRAYAATVPTARTCE